MRWWVALILLLCAAAAAAPSLQLEGSFVQGGLVRGQAVAGSEVRFAGRGLAVDRDGRFLIGFDRDEPSGQELTVRFPDGSRAVRRLEIAPRAYRIERIEGLPPRQVTPSAEDLERIRADAELIEAAKARGSAAGAVAAGFVWPVTGRISGI
ncbi:MAG TPA: hypothetical protein VFY19_09155, partial [Geminicoccaceae bacterium]|nr:hypothetical protein [Geminicoccaceae bacterium]